MWLEVQQVLEHQRRELTLTGPEISKRISETGLDDHIYELISLNFLEISKTTLALLDEKIGSLRSLNRLILHDNKLQTLPGAIGCLTKLKFLDISHNVLGELPDIFSTLTELHSLNASVNPIRKIGDLSKCVHLTYVDLSFNELEEFPESLCSAELVNLLEIKLNSNKLANISPELVLLTTLKQLDLSGNKISVIPKEVSQCPKLKEVLLHDNPIKDSRLNKLTGQKPPKFKAVLDYIRDNCVALKVPLPDGDKKKKGGGKGQKKKNGKEEAENEVQLDTIQILPSDDSTVTVTWKSRTQEVRPYIVCCILKNIQLDDPATMKKFIALQTELHDELCDKRTAATIATHDLDLITGNLVYDAKSPSAIKLHPLKRASEVTAESLMSQLNQEADALRKEKKRNTYSGIHKYLNLLHEKSVYPFLAADDGTVISFPPITNSDKTKINVGTRNVLLEVTSSKSLPICKTVAERVITSCLQQSLVRVNTSESGKTVDGLPGSGDGAEDTNKPSGTDPKTVVVQQVKIVDAEGGLRVIFPSRMDLTLEGYNVIRPYE